MMASDDERGRVPLGPGRPTAHGAAPRGSCPRFGDDPAGWLAWIDAALAAGIGLADATRPGSWTDPAGRSWRVIAAPEGPELRPALGSQFLAAHDMPLISAMLLEDGRIRAELTWRDGREVRTIDAGTVSVVDLGLAMLTLTELPHESLARVGDETWARARERWKLLTDTAQAPIS